MIARAKPKQAKGAFPLPSPAADWADPGFFAGKSRVGDSLRVLRQLVKPPEGHKTLPTLSGVILIALSLGIGTAAYNTSSNILFITLAFLLSSLLLSGILSWQNFRGCRWRLLVDGHFRAGEPAPVRVEIENTKRWLPTYSMTFNLAATGSGATRAELLRDRLDPGERREIEWLFTPARRGIETVLVASLESRFPFGFLRKLLPGRCSAEVAVWPTRVPYLFRPPGGPGSRTTGATRQRRGSGTELINLRPYVAGDAPRLVHWKASAREGRLLVRELAEERQQSLLLWLETTSSLWSTPEAFEKLCSVAACLAEDLFRVDRLRGAAVDDEPVISISRLADVHAFLGRLARLEPRPGERRASRPPGPTVITFEPGPAGRVIIHVGGIEAGSA